MEEGEIIDFPKLLKQIILRLPYSGEETITSDFTLKLYDPNRSHGDWLNLWRSLRDSKYQPCQGSVNLNYLNEHFMYSDLIVTISYKGDIFGFILMKRMILTQEPPLRDFSQNQDGDEVGFIIVTCNNTPVPNKIQFGLLLRCIGHVYFRENGVNNIITQPLNENLAAYYRILGYVKLFEYRGEDYMIYFEPLGDLIEITASTVGLQLEIYYEE